MVKIPMNRPSVWAELTFEEKPLFFEIFSKQIAFKCHGLHLKTPIKTSPNSSRSYLLFALLVATITYPPTSPNVEHSAAYRTFGGKISADFFSGCSTYLVKKLLPQLRCSTELPFPSPPPPLAPPLSPTLPGAWPSLEPREHLCERLSWSLDPWVWGQQGNPNN